MLREGTHKHCEPSFLEVNPFNSTHVNTRLMKRNLKLPTSWPTAVRTPVAQQVASYDVAGKEAAGEEGVAGEGGSGAEGGGVEAKEASGVCRGPTRRWWADGSRPVASPTRAPCASSRSTTAPAPSASSASSTHPSTGTSRLTPSSALLGPVIPGATKLVQLIPRRWLRLRIRCTSDLEPLPPKRICSEPIWLRVHSIDELKSTGTCVVLEGELKAPPEGATGQVVRTSPTTVCS